MRVYPYLANFMTRKDFEGMVGGNICFFLKHPIPEIGDLTDITKQVTKMYGGKESNVVIRNLIPLDSYDE